MYDVIISGYYGFNNSGDDSLLAAIVGDLKNQNPNIRILVLSFNPEQTKQIYNVDSINRFNIFSIISAMKKAKLFINGGGNLIQDRTSTQSLLYYLWLIKLAKMNGLPVMLYANGIGPIGGKMNRKRVTNTLNSVDLITLREELSKQELENLNVVKPEILVTADPVFSLNPAPDTEIDKLLLDEGIEPHEKLFCISVRSWTLNDHFNRDMAGAIDTICKKYELTPVFIPMQQKVDTPISKKILSMMQVKGYILSEQYTYGEILGIMRKMTITVAMRLHGLIYAAAAGVPVAGIVYDPKVKGFMDYVGQCNYIDADNVNYEILIQMLENIIKNRHEISEQLLKLREDLREKSIYNAKITIERFF